MKIVIFIFAIISVISFDIFCSYLAIRQLKREKQRDDYIKSIAYDVKFLTTEAVNYEKK